MESQDNSIPQTNEEMKNSPPKNEQMEICPKSRTGNKNICRRFSDEQIQSLESIFKREAKLEPGKKVQLARDIGLQPRQVAIWFQNKRARWKSKQIEQEYRDLRANYDSLYVQFDGLKRENQSLLIQLEELNGLVRNLDRVNLAKKYGKLKKYPNIGSNEKIDQDDIRKIYEENNDKTSAKCSEKTDDREILSWSEGDEILSHLALPDKWCDFSSSGFFDQSAGVSSWWED